MKRDRFPLVVHVLLTRPVEAAEQVFLLRRAGTGFMDGYYVPPGGHVRAGERLEDAARRECLEETGANPAKLAPLCVLPYRSGSHQGVNLVFSAAGLDRAPGIGEPGRSDDAGWFPVDRLPERVAPWLGDVLDLRSEGGWFRELYWP